jgi:antitoxin (DNA-binding transcriptional repressor) of toxin-antitoxin stability system
LKKIEADEGRTIEDYLGTAGDEPVVLTRNGRPLAVLIAAGGRDMESLALSFNEDFWQIIRESRASAAAHGTIPLEQAVAEIEAEEAAQSRPRRRRAS